MTAARDVILAGLPRSGTTLVCHLINRVPNSVALHEPIDPQRIAAELSASRSAVIRDFFAEQRASLLANGRAASKASGGKVPDNHLGDIDRGTGRRRDLLDGDHIVVDKPLDEDLDLFIKQPMMFTALLPTLHAEFPCFATVRNPLAVLMSWHSTNLPVSLGRVPAAEALDAKLLAALDAEPNLLSRQLQILDWCCRIYRTYIPDMTERYENVVVSSGQVLARLCPGAASIDVPLQSKNRNQIYDRAILETVANRLLQSDGAYWEFYTRAEVADLASSMASD